MRKVNFSLLIIISILFLHGSIGCQNHEEPFPVRYDSTAGRAGSAEAAPGEIIVKFKPEAFNEQGELAAESIMALNAGYGLISMERVFKGKPSADLAYIYELRFPESADINKLVQEYASDLYVVYAEPNYTMSALEKEQNAD